MQRIEANEATNYDWGILARYTRQGYFRESRIKEIQHPATPFLQFNLTKNIKQFTIQVTQNCNLRCKYCTYDGNYNYQRIHSNKIMTLGIMKKCVDFIMARSSGIAEISLGFYGGEPLLEIENIKKCVDYVKETYRGRSVRYVMTTNELFLMMKILISCLKTGLMCPLVLMGQGLSMIRIVFFRTAQARLTR